MEKNLTEWRRTWLGGEDLDWVEKNLTGWRRVWLDSEEFDWANNLTEKWIKVKVNKLIKTLTCYCAVLGGVCLFSCFHSPQTNLKLDLSPRTGSWSRIAPPGRGAAKHSIHNLWGSYGGGSQQSEEPCMSVRGGCTSPYVISWMEEAVLVDSSFDGGSDISNETSQKFVITVVKIQREFI